MKNIQGIQLIMESNEELLPDFFMDFPYICSCVEFDKYIDPVVPWHWHHAVELFYIKSGRVEYTTPNGKWIFPAGTGGFVNSNVLHSSRVSSTKDGTVQLLHLFDPELLPGGISNRIEERYIRPLTDRSGLEMICLSPEDPGQAALFKPDLNWRKAAGAMRSLFGSCSQKYGLVYWNWHVLRQKIYTKTKIPLKK